MAYEQIIAQLPYSEPFLFVDELLELTDSRVVGRFHFREDLGFYRGHFNGHPVTPGVILTECCAQIGLACLGIHLSGGSLAAPAGFGLSSTAMEFYIPVLPGEKVRVVSDLHYFRFGKLKCGVMMYNEQNTLVCKGVLAGMIQKKQR